MLANIEKRTPYLITSSFSEEGTAINSKGRMVSDAIKAIARPVTNANAMRTKERLKSPGIRCNQLRLSGVAPIENP